MMDKVQALEVLRERLRVSHSRLDPERVTIGDFTYGQPLILTWGENTKLTIGKFCSIGANVQIYMGGNHHNEWCTTYPFNALLPAIWGEIDEGRAMTKGDVWIGNDVWIGENVTILSGVTIGDGAVIAAGSVVTKNVPEYEIFGGNPAKFIKYREIAHNVKPPHWWGWPLEKIAEAVPYLCSGDTAGLNEFSRRWEEEHND